MDSFGKFKVTGFLKKAFISLDPKKASTFNDEARLKKVAQYIYIYIYMERERERMILHKIFDIVSYVIYKQYVQWIIREKSAVS